MFRGRRGGETDLFNDVTPDARRATQQRPDDLDSPRMSQRFCKLSDVLVLIRSRNRPLPVQPDTTHKSVAAKLAGDEAAANDVRLVLPETGVCSAQFSAPVDKGSGCCSTAAPALVSRLTPGGNCWTCLAVPMIWPSR